MYLPELLRRVCKNPGFFHFGIDKKLSYMITFMMCVKEKKNDVETIKGPIQMEEEKLQPRLEVISQIRQIRKEQKITQEALAQRAGTKKSNISRLESGKYNPSLDLLIRVAACLGKRIHIWME